MQNKFSKSFLLCAMLVFLSLSARVADAQVSLTATGGAPVGSFTNLGNAFAAINAGTHTGAIAISITANTAEAASAILNASGSGAASYTSISISPSGGVASTVSGAVAGALVDLNGADNVTIDGLNTGGNALTFENTSTGVTSTIRFIGDASNNTVRNATLLGASSSIASGTVFFSTGTTTGNDANIVTACTFGGSGANFASTAVYSAGTATAGIENSGNTVSNCNIADFFSATLINYGVFISAGSTDWTVSGNKFYQTASRTYTTGNTHSVIQISTGNNHAVANNTIGFASATGTGVYTMLGAVATRFIGIGLAVGTTTASSVQGNTITAISLATSSGAATANGIICGINITAGNVNVGTSSANTIGATTGVNAITAIPTTTGGAVVGINCSSTGTISIQNNTIGALSSSGTAAAIAGSVAGINISGGATSMTISGNTIGNATVDNMRGGTLGLTTGSSVALGINITSSQVANTVTNNTVQNLTSYGSNTGSVARGIYITTGAIAHNISGNTVRNLASNSTSVSFGSGQCPVIGIYLGGGNNASISGNAIYNLGLTNTGAFGSAALGISVAANTNTTISKNTIYDIYNTSTSVSTTTPGAAAGIFIRSGTTGVTIVNNMISLGTGRTENTAFLGIWGQHGSTPDPLVKVYYNTVNITGTATTGAQPSFCFARTDFSATARTAAVDIRNNLFTNDRTGGTGSHYAIANNYGVVTSSTTGWGVNASNYNALNANPATIGYWSSTNRDFAAWQTASASDANSVTAIAVNYTNPANDLHLNPLLFTGAESAGVIIAGINDDIDANVRFGSGGYTGNGTAPDLGADEFDLVLPNCASASGGTISPAIVSACEGFTTTLASPTATTGTGITYQWKVATVSGGPYVNVTGGSGATTRTYTTGALTTGTYFYILETTCSFGPVVGVSNEVTVNVGVVPTVTVSPTSATYCSPGGDATILTAGGAATYTWSPAAGLSATTGTTVNATPTANVTYTVVGTAANGCTATAATNITVAPAVSLASLTATPSSVCSGGTSQLQANLNAFLVNTYTFSAGTGTTLDPMVGATTVLTTGNDDTPTAAAANIGFTFPFNGTTYTQYSVSPDGWLLLGGAVAASSFTNQVTLASNTPKIYPLWDDLATGTTGNVQVLVTGTSPNQIFIVQWFVTVPRATGGPANSTFQAWLYEGSGRIEFRYGTMGVATGTMSAGLTGSATNFHSITYATNTSNPAVANDNNLVVPPAGTIYTYMPPVVGYAWSPATFLNSTNIANPVASGITATTNYMVTVSYGVCTDTASVSISAGSPLSSTATATPSNSVCANIATTLNANPVGGGGPYTYSWSGPNGFTSSVSNPSIAAAAVTDAGAYVVTITDNCGATTTGSFTLVVNALPNVQATATSSVYCTPGTGVNITGSGANTYTWAPAAGLSGTTGATVTATPAAAVTYTVVGTDANGCTASNVATLDVAAAITTIAATANPAIICGDTSSLTVTATSASAAYCQPTYTSGTGFGDYISSVQLNTLTNTTVGAAAPYYTLYPASGTTTTTLTAGSTYTITLSPGTYTINDLAAWIDYNQNGNLADAGEKLGEASDVGASPATTSFTFTVPANALNGTVRLRVRDIDHATTNDMDPCAAQSGYGETEDYDITIVGGVDPMTYDWSPIAYFATNNMSTVQASNITATTTFTVVATNAAGCSNTTTTTVTKSATPVSVTATQVTASSCSSNTGSAQAVPAGGQGTYTLLWSNTETTSTASNLAATTYTVTVTDGYGCMASNSVTVGQLNPPTITLNNVTACGTTTLDAGAGFTYLWSDASTAQTLMVTASGTPSVTITDGNGCTATDNATVTINTPTTGTDVQSACGTYVWINGTTYTASNNTATFTIVGGNANGCDSVVTLNLTINAPTTGTDVQSACGSYVWINGTTYTASNNTATFTIAGGAANGCDSVVTLNLTINTPTTGTDVQTACDSLTWIDGATYFANNNTATFTITGGAANGCDSVVTLNLTVTTLDNSVTLNTLTLTATQTGATYQWVDCNNGNAAIVGETNQSFTPTVTGDFAVSISDASGCSVLSSCTNIVINSLGQTITDLGLALYPNPTTGLVNLELKGFNEVRIELIDVTGRVLQQIQTADQLIHINMTEYPSGMYFVRVNQGNEQHSLKVVKL